MDRGKQSWREHSKVNDADSKNRQRYHHDEHHQSEEEDPSLLSRRSKETIDSGDIDTAGSRERARSNPAAFRTRINSLNSNDGDKRRISLESKHSDDRKLFHKPHSHLRKESDPNIPHMVHESKSLDNISHGGGDKWPKVTRHVLYKEAIYTCAHMLGNPSNRFPSSQEDITIYAHETFSVDVKEQKAVNEHVESEPFPFTIVNTKVRRAVGLQPKDANGLSDPYCVVALETEDSLHQKQWQTINIGSPLKPKKFQHKKERVRPNAENRRDQIYEDVPVYIKTSVQQQTLEPSWEQRFQCLALRPGVDILTVEVWDHDSEDNDAAVLKAIKSYKDSENVSVDQAMRTNQQNSSHRKRKPDDFLGKATILVSEIPVEGVEKWFVLSGKAHTKDKQAHGKIRLQLWLVHAYRHGRHYEEIVEPKFMLEKLWDWILKVEKSKFDGDGEWDGTIPKAATCLLFQYALQNGISEDSQAMIRWNSYAKIHLNVHGMEHRLHDLDEIVTKTIRRDLEEKPRRFSGGSERRDSGSERRDSGSDRQGSGSEKLGPDLERRVSGSERRGSGSERRGSGSERRGSGDKNFMEDKIGSIVPKGGKIDMIHDVQEHGHHSEIEVAMLQLVKEEICPIVRNHLHESEERVREAVKSFKQCREILSKLEDAYTLHTVLWCFEAALRMSILEWYQMKFTEIVQMYEGIKRHELVTSIAQVIDAVNGVLKQGVAKWSPIFWLDGMTEYMPIVYDEFQKMIIHDVETICWIMLEFYDDNPKLRKILMKNKEEERELCKTLFDLYVQTQVFVQCQDEVLKYEQPIYEQLSLYHRWFRPVLVLWLGFALIKGSEVINKAINIDEAMPVDNMVKTSSSAVDTANVFYQLLNFWRTLAWPDVPESYVILNFLLEVVCYYTDLYAGLQYNKIAKEGYFDTVDRFDISQRFCTAINNIEYVKEYMMKIPNEVMYHLLHDLNEVCGITKETKAYRKRLDNVISKTLFNVEIHFKAILTGIGTRLQPEINVRLRHVFEFLVTANESYLGEALVPIFDYLEENISILHDSLLEMNFVRVLKLLWNIICDEMSNVAIQTTMHDESGQNAFFMRVLKIYPILKDYFEGNGAGLKEDDIYSRHFADSWELINYMTIKTKFLIETYYGQRGDEQMRMKSKTRYGTIKIRLSYWQGKLCAEIISVSNLIAIDQSHFWSLCKKSKPSSDPIVQLELMPESIFHLEDMYKTTVKWKTLNPVYNEKFYWNASSMDCENRNAVIVLTVKDYDVLSRNEFLGEAVVPLQMIPGIARTPVPQPMTLNLRTVSAKNCNPILMVLKTRHNDTEAQKFYNKQMARVVIKDIENT